MTKFVRLACSLLILGLTASSPGVASPDVPIAPSKDGALDAHLDWDNDLGSLFVLVRWNWDQEEYTTWSLHMSDANDRGAAWTEIYNWRADSHDVRAVDLAVMGGWAYVGFVESHDRDQLKLMRFWTDDGEMDPEFGVQVALDLPAPIEEIDLAADSMDSRDLIFVSALTEEGTVHVSWTDRSVHPQFHSVDPGVSDALLGLDATVDEWHLQGTQLLLTYIAQDELRLLRLDDRHRWRQDVLASGADVYSARTTSVAAFEGFALVAHQSRSSQFGQGVGYHYSQDDGRSWEGRFLFPNGLEPMCDPKVSARSQEGFGLLYGLENGPFDPILVLRSPGYELPAWGPLNVINSYDWRTCYAEGFDFEWLGGEFGAVYFDDDKRAYFTWASKDLAEPGSRSVPRAPAGISLWALPTHSEP